MSATAFALLGFVALQLALSVALVSARGVYVFFRGRAVNSFSPDHAGDDAFTQRLVRAHANCYENLPAWAAVMLLAIATGHADLTDPLAPWLLAARLGQSAVHLTSTSQPAVWTRFGLFAMQLTILGWWVVQLASA